MAELPATTDEPAKESLWGYFITPLLGLLVVLLLAAAIHAVSELSDQAITMLAGLCSPFAIAVWATRAKPDAGASRKIPLVMLQGVLWVAMVILAIESELISSGIHQPGPALLLFFPPIGFLYAIAAVAAVSSRRRAALKRREKGDVESRIRTRRNAAARDDGGTGRA